MHYLSAEAGDGVDLMALAYYRHRYATSLSVETDSFVWWCLPNDGHGNFSQTLVGRNCVVEIDYEAS